ncbi:Hypothetical predicted protein [Paramuricea clavata]|uniref:Uncharacterized protein n=1 Tax=Paramuricea clavata TaxID=317549 RepID=A0A6S7FZ81_PARCT|nr:Hypothetical predicted protein [Paramuricea clavata]
MEVKLRLKTNPREKGRKRTKYDTAKLKDEDTRKTFTIALKNRHMLKLLRQCLENREEEKTMDKRPFMEARRRERGDQQKDLWNTLRKSEDTAQEEICREEVGGEEEYMDRQKDMDGRQGGNLLSSKEDIQARWTEHFQEILNREGPTNPKTEEEDNGFGFTDIIEEIATNEPTLGEVKSAIARKTEERKIITDRLDYDRVTEGRRRFSAKKIHELLKNICMEV